MAKKSTKAGLNSFIPSQAETKEKRSKKVGSQLKKPVYKKHTFTVNEVHLEKIRYIAVHDPGGMKKVVYDAFKAEIDKYEKENGEIVL